MTRTRLRDRSFEDLPPALLGAVAVIVLGSLVAGAFVAGTLGLFRDRYEMSGVFTEASGLSVGAAVQVAGVEVGTVTGIHPDFEQGQVVVSWEVDRDVDLGPATRASLSLGTLFGGYGIRLTDPGGAPTMASLPVAERRIPLSRTQVPDGIIGSIDAATQTLQGLDADLVNDVSEQVAEVLAGTRGDLPEVLEHLGAVADVLEAREADIERLVEDGLVLVEAVADRDEQLFLLVDRAAVLLDELTSRRDALATILGEGHDAVVTLTDFLADQRGELAELSDGLHLAVSTVAGRQAEVAAILANLGPTLANLAAAEGLGPWVDFVATEFGPFQDTSSDASSSTARTGDQP